MGNELCSCCCSKRTEYHACESTSTPCDVLMVDCSNSFAESVAEYVISAFQEQLGKRLHAYELLTDHEDAKFSMENLHEKYQVLKRTSTDTSDFEALPPTIQRITYEEFKLGGSRYKSNVLVCCGHGNLNMIGDVSVTELCELIMQNNSYHIVMLIGCSCGSIRTGAWRSFTQTFQAERGPVGITFTRNIFLSELRKSAVTRVIPYFMRNMQTYTDKDSRTIARHSIGMACAEAACQTDPITAWNDSDQPPSTVSRFIALKTKCSDEQTNLDLDEVAVFHSWLKDKRNDVESFLAQVQDFGQGGDISRPLSHLKSKLKYDTVAKELFKMLNFVPTKGIGQHVEQGMLFSDNWDVEEMKITARDLAMGFPCTETQAQNALLKMIFKHEGEVFFKICLLYRIEQYCVDEQMKLYYHQKDDRNIIPIEQVRHCLKLDQLDFRALPGDKELFAKQCFRSIKPHSDLAELCRTSDAARKVKLRSLMSIDKDPGEPEAEVTKEELQNIIMLLLEFIIAGGKGKAKKGDYGVKAFEKVKKKRPEQFLSWNDEIPTFQCAEAHAKPIADSTLTRCRFVLCYYLGESNRIEGVLYFTDVHYGDDYIRCLPETVLTNLRIREADIQTSLQVDNVLAKDKENILRECVRYAESKGIHPFSKVAEITATMQYAFEFVT